MEIPYTISNRPDTGLWNAKIGIWLFLASEVMLFGGLFSAYIFLRLDAPPGLWPHGLLNVPVGTMNTAVLILSSVTVVLAWAALKMRNYRAYWWYMLVTILCGVIFLAVKLAYEWPQKFDHFGAYIKPNALEKYEKYLGNHHLSEKGLPPRLEITGHLHNREALSDPNIKEYEIGLDPANADPTNPAMDRPHFLYIPPTDKIGVVEKEDVERATMFLPTHSTYFATYFTITGLHGLHVLGGVLVFIYMWLPVSKKVYQRNPEHLANRVEVCGLFWHFVDLVWIFVFPLFYLLLSMNNPPDVSPDPAEHEEYAHNVQKHVKGYLMVGAALLFCTALTVALSYVDFGTRKANIAVAMLVATFKAGLVAAIFMHLAAEKRLIYRVLVFTGFFVFALFWLTFLTWSNPIVH
jgi:cytochrome c oxidase subunit 3